MRKDNSHDMITQPCGKTLSYTMQHEKSHHISESTSEPVPENLLV